MVHRLDLYNFKFPVLLDCTPNSYIYVAWNDHTEPVFCTEDIIDAWQLEKSSVRAAQYTFILISELGR